MGLERATSHRLAAAGNAGSSDYVFLAPVADRPCEGLSESKQQLENGRPCSGPYLSQRQCELDYGQSLTLP